MKLDQTTLQAAKTMRIRFVVPGFPTFNIYSTIARYTTALGPVLLATVAAQKPNWKVEVIDENNYSADAARDPNGYLDHRYLLDESKPDVVAIYGGLSSTIPRLRELAKFYREQGCITIAGGQHFYAGNVEEALNFDINYLCLGEGEQTVNELLDTWGTGNPDVSHIKGLVYLRNGEIVRTPERPPLPIAEIEKLPVPDFSLVRQARISLYPVSWNRGCCMKCEFCTVKGNVRYLPAAYLVKQLTTLHRRYQATGFFIVDDLFSQKREETMEFCREITQYQKENRVKFHFTVQIRLDKANDAELLSAMRGAGIQVLAIGYESPIADELKAMNKCLRPEDMIKNTDIYHRAGFLVHGMFIFGYPAATKLDFKMSSPEREKAYRLFIRKAKIDTIQILLPVPLPGTELTERLKNEDRIFDRNDIGLEYYDGNFQLFVPDAPLNAPDAQLSAQRLMKHFYRSGSMFSIMLSICTFPTLIFFLPNLKKGWRMWFRNWRNSIWRFVGWRIIRRWQTNRNLDAFAQKLVSAQNKLQAARAGRHIA